VAGHGDGGSAGRVDRMGRGDRLGCVLVNGGADANYGGSGWGSMFTTVGPCIATHAMLEGHDPCPPR
jgi:hypothetical protein